MLVMCVCGGLRATADEFYVATTGDDANPGTYAEPFETLAQAQLAVRSAWPTATDAIKVWVRGGTYYLDSTLEFGTADSGSETVPVSYAGYSNETVVISGAIPLAPSWSTYSGNILVADVGTGLKFDMLFVDDDLQVMARYPNYDEDTAILNGYASDAISSTKVAGWADPSGGFYRGLHGSMWGGNSYRITGKNGTSLTTAWVGDNNRGSGVHSTYRMVENIFEELDAEGEWFYNASTGKLYFYPPAGVDAYSASFEGASLEELIRVVGSATEKVKYLTFSNFTFTGTHRTLFTGEYEPLNRSDWCAVRAGAIFIQDAESVTISDSIFDRIGGNGVFMSAYNRNHLITNNEFLDNGATCVSACGSKDALWDVNEWDEYVTDADDIDLTTEVGPKTDDYPKDITISYNHMDNMGRFEKQTAGVNLFLAESITVSHNTIHSSPRSGINICDGAWGGHIIEFNDVFDCIRETSDHGPFNSWGRDRFYSIGGYNHSGSDGATKRPYAFTEAWKTTHIRNNRFHYDEPTSFGIDLDDGSSNYEIYNNLLLNTQIKLREGFSRVVYNNIQINEQCEFHVWYDQSQDVFTNNIVVNSTAYNTKYMYTSKANSADAVLDWNVFYNAGDEVALPDDSWLTSGYDAHSVIDNPLFTDTSSNDYTVATNSPALALGFVNFPMDQFGKPGAPEPGAIEYDPGPSPYSDAEPLMGGEVASLYDEATKSFLGAPDLSGVFFEDLPEDSYAALQGFEEYDLIRGLNGNDVTTKQSFWLIYNSIAAGSTVSVDLFRNQDSEDFSFEKTSGYEQLNDTAGVIYTGTWSTQEVSYCFNGDLQYTETAGDAFEITFYGEDVSFESMTDSDMGNVDVYIDGVLDQTISCYSAAKLYQQTVYEKTGLTEGLHTLRAVNAASKKMSLDSVHVGQMPDLNYQVSTSASDTVTPTVSNSDLAQTAYLSSSATGGDEVATQHAELFNGDAGTDADNTSETSNVRMSSDNTVTVIFDTSINSLGYDLTGIDTVFGWNTGSGGRSNQGYEILLTFVDGTQASLAGPEHWAPNSPASYWTKVSFTATATNGVMASGVKAVTFDITEDANANGVLIGREFDVFGVATVDPNAPEPEISSNIVYTTSQFDTNSAPAISDNDLAQTAYLSSAGTGGNEASQHAQLFNGLLGNTDGDTNDDGEVRLTSAETISVTFDTSVNTAGYDLTEINTYFGWGTDGGGRSNQGYELLLTFVDGSTLSLAGPEHWEPNSPASYWTMVSFSEKNGGVMASGVKSVTFDISEDANASGVAIAREFDIFGVPTEAAVEPEAAELFADSIIFSNGYFSTWFSGTVGAHYQVEFTEDLTASNGWQVVTNILSLETSPTELAVPATNATGFYRVTGIE
jgi:hypothetical protein